MEGYFEECEKIYKDIVIVYNEAQKEDTTRIEYKRLDFDYHDKCTCHFVFMLPGVTEAWEACWVASIILNVPICGLLGLKTWFLFLWQKRIPCIGFVC